MHAIGAGITLIEVQQNVDLTYRLYDYGRPRELHLDEGIAVSVAEPSASAAQVKRSEPTKAEPVQSDVAPESTKGTEQAPAQEERSIMFQKNDSILLPQSDNNAAPGITIPAPGSSQEP